MTNIAALCETWFSNLSGLGRDVGSRFRAGASPIEVNAALLRRGLTAPAQLIQLYEFTDGLQIRDGDTIGDIVIVPGYYFESFDRSISIYDSVCQSPEWDFSWFPFLTSGGGDFYAVVCNPDDTRFGNIAGFINGEPDTLVEYESLASMIGIIIHRFTNGSYHLKDGELEVDDERALATADHESDFKPYLWAAI